MNLSIIIPTHGRPRILQKCLDAIAAQTVLRHDPLRGSAQHDALEAIIVSDGPDDATAEMMEGLSWPFPIQYFAIPKSQQGVCRNRAVEKARGKYCLLIGDDIFLAPDACEWHLRAHEKSQISNSKPQKSSKIQIPNSNGAVLGFTTWDPALNITPLMRWLERSGVQFGYSKIAKYAHGFLPERVQHRFTYTSNFSLPTRILRRHPFREDVSLYGWEDIEWGRRLAGSGVRLLYEPDAKAYHHHAFTDDEIWERSRMLGASAVAMEKLAPSLGLRPGGWRKIAYRLCALLPSSRGRHCRAFLRGVRAHETTG